MWGGSQPLFPKNTVIGTVFTFAASEVAGAFIETVDGFVAADTVKAQNFLAVLMGKRLDAVENRAARAVGIWRRNKIVKVICVRRRQTIPTLVFGQQDNCDMQFTVRSAQNVKLTSVVFFKTPFVKLS